MLLKDQSQISSQRGMPVNDVGASQYIESISSETVQLYYYNSGVLTADAGQAAGTLVVGQLAYGGIKNGLGSMQATDKDTSLTFTSTALTTERAFPWDKAEALDTSTALARITDILAGYSNGEYCVDYTTGTIYGKKASTQTSLASTAYKIQHNVPAGSSTITEKVDIIKLGGAAIDAANAARSATTKVLVVQPVDASGNIISGGIATLPQALGLDASGVDTYTTIVTASGAKTNMAVSLQGANDAIISIDSGVTDHFYIPAGTVWIFNNINIADTKTVQAKNASAGNNYSNLSITIW